MVHHISEGFIAIFSHISSTFWTLHQVFVVIRRSKGFLEILLMLRRQGLIQSDFHLNQQWPEPQSHPLRVHFQWPEHNLQVDDHQKSHKSKDTHATNEVRRGVLVSIFRNTSFRGFCPATNIPIVWHTKDQQQNEAKATNRMHCCRKRIPLADWGDFQRIDLVLPGNDEIRRQIQEGGVESQEPKYPEKHFSTQKGPSAACENSKGRKQPVQHGPLIQQVADVERSIKERAANEEESTHICQETHVQREEDTSTWQFVWKHFSKEEDAECIFSFLLPYLQGGFLQQLHMFFLQRTGSMHLGIPTTQVHGGQRRMENFVKFDEFREVDECLIVIAVVLTQHQGLYQTATRKRWNYNVGLDFRCKRCMLTCLM